MQMLISQSEENGDGDKGKDEKYSDNDISHNDDDEIDGKRY